MNPLLLSLVIVIIISCSQKKVKQPEPLLVNAIPRQQTVKKLSVRFVGKVDFRRTFAGAQFLDDEKEIDKYYRKQEKSNPELMYPEHDSLGLKKAI